MDHESASLLLSECVAGKLTGPTAAEVAAHVQECSECGALAETLAAVRGEVAEHGQALWLPHPPALDLARFASDDRSMSTADFALIGAHVRACPACGTETRLAREAQVPSAWRWLRAWLPEFMDRRALAVVAFAALAVVLAYPAYIGLVEYPRAVSRSSHGTTAAPVPNSPSSVSGGPAAVLILTGESRGAASVVPLARLRAGQTQLALLIDAAPPNGDPLELELRNRAGQLLWHARAQGAELWDAQQHVMSLAIPVVALVGGEFVLSIGASGRPPEVNRRFRVELARVAPSIPASRAPSR